MDVRLAVIFAVRSERSALSMKARELITVRMAAVLIAEINAAGPAV